MNVGSDGDIAWSLGISAAEVFLGLARVLIILIFDDKCILFCSSKCWTGDMISYLALKRTLISENVRLTQSRK